jgi:putative endopeptidase
MRWWMFLAMSAACAAQILDPAAIDRTANPCTDFYQYSCGRWISEHPLPPGQPMLARYGEIRGRNQRLIRDLVEEAARNRESGAPAQRQLGNYYAACMAEAAIDKAGIAPLTPYLERIRLADSKRALFRDLARLEMEGVQILISLGSEPDWKDPSATLAVVRPIRFSLDDPALYSKVDGAKTREQFASMVADMFVLLGDDPVVAAKSAATVLRIETALAANAPSSADLRDPSKAYHKTAVDDLPSLAPVMDWKTYLDGMGLGGLKALNAIAPAYLQALGPLLDAVSLEDWKTWFRWRIVEAWTPMLAGPFVSRDFLFSEKLLLGAAAQRPRWQHCVGYAEAQLGDALGQMFASRVLGADGKAVVERVSRDLERELALEIGRASWLSDGARAEALKKLHAVSRKIGYPDSWIDYGAVAIAPGDFAGNYRRLAAFHKRRVLARVGQPPDRGAWDMPVSTMNAYYDVPLNTIKIPAGILQPPFYVNGANPAELYGTLGTLIAHELTHGFDDQGRKVDSRGKLRDWWSPDDEKEFQKRAACFVNQYSAYEAIPGVPVDGRRTLGENIADNGGARVAWEAFERNSHSEAGSSSAEDFTPQQRFFLSFAQLACQNVSPEALRMQTQRSPHTVNRWRVNGTLSNMPEFSETFACGPPAIVQQCRVW